MIQNREEVDFGSFICKRKKDLVDEKGQEEENKV